MQLIIKFNNYLIEYREMIEMFNVFIIATIFNLFQSTPAEERRNRDKKTVELFLSRYQYSSLKIKPFPYSFFDINLTKIRYFPPLLNNMVIESVEEHPNKIKVSEFILPMLCNLSVQFHNTTRALYEYNVIIEISVKDALFNVGLGLEDNLALDRIETIALNYSKKRNFLVSDRFKEFSLKEDIMNTEIKTSINELGKKLLKKTNYLQIDYKEIMYSFKYYTSIINKQINENITLVSGYYSVVILPSLTVIWAGDELHVSNLTVQIDYVLDNKGVSENNSIKMRFETVKYYCNKEAIHSPPQYERESQYPKVNDLLFERFKEDFIAKKKQYYNKLFN